ncbi:MAG: response regulator [Chloroflexota bacterium]|nr:response regulator [Chloroflexota bacterium]MDE2962133.1 response regulator [Chloroflexota bacterium]
MMEENGGRGRENATPRDRLSRLSEATLRINESLDFDTVLQEVVNAARALTDSRYGVITTLDGSGRPQDFVTSGMTEDERRAYEDFLPDGMLVYQYVSGLEGPLRVGDYGSHLASVGLSDFSPVPVSSLLIAPIRHMGESVGTIALGRQEPGVEFSDEDEETLVMFASQAALVIANARRYREERRARADLEALVDTSPIGVVVFDVENRRVRSLNRESRRIIGDLLEPDGSWEAAISSMTCRRGDGTEVSLGDLTVYDALGVGETVRAEEVTLELPDGRSVTTLLNGTPILGEDGGVETFVVTMQDLAPLEEMERLRAEFLAMVSHELRTPLSSIRGSADTLLDEAASLDPAEMRQFHRIIVEQSEQMRDLINNLLDVARIETGALSVAPEPSDLAALVDEARSAFLRDGNRNRLNIDLGTDLPLVLADRRRIVQVLGNLLSNAARHSGGASPIEVRARRQGLQVALSVADRGRGILAEDLPRLFRKYSRLDGGSRDGDPAGTGLGLAICKGIVEAHGGRIWAESQGPDLGARFTFTVPAVEEDTVIGAARPGVRSRRRMGRRTRVLAVDDDPVALRNIRAALTRAGYQAVVTADPAEVPRLMEQERPQLVLMDLMLPGGDGIELMQRILATTDVPVIFVSAYGQEENVTRALDMGAADYVVKPFSASELTARIRAALRQRAGLGPTAQPPPYTLGDLSIDYAQRRVTLAGRAVELTATEYAVLYELSANAGTALTHDQLVVRVWGPNRSGDNGLVRTIIRRLRRRLEDSAANPRYIFTEPRIGYRMARGDEPGQTEG